MPRCKVVIGLGAMLLRFWAGRRVWRSTFDALSHCLATESSVPVDPLIHSYCITHTLFIPTPPGPPPPRTHNALHKRSLQSAHRPQQHWHTKRRKGLPADVSAGARL